MRRMPMTPRPDWAAKADAVGLVYHSTGGAPYWDECVAYCFDLAEIEVLENAAEQLHGLCLDLVDEVVTSSALQDRLAIPPAYRELIAQSWKSRQPSLYGRFDFAYDGASPPKLYEYNADTPTAVFEAATFQWLWLEELLASGALPPGTDQFNSLYDKLRARFGLLFPDGGFVHFAADVADSDVTEDRQTVRFFEDLARQAGIEPKYIAMRDIGLTADGRFVDTDGFELQAAFKLYPWEQMLRESYSPHLHSAGVRWLEPAWKAILSNKAILPLLWQRHHGHPNLLPAFFDDDPACASLGDSYARKPIFSREGADIELVRNGVADPIDKQGYGSEGYIRQALHVAPDFDGHRPVVGAWIVGDEAAGIGLREDDSLITGNLARFVPHVIEVG